MILAHLFVVLLRLFGVLSVGMNTWPVDPQPVQPPRPAAPSAEDVSDAIKSIVEKHGVPGMAAAVTTRDRIVMIGAAGVRALGAEAPVLTTDRFHIGSCTKSMTATLVAMLVQEGKLRWTTTLPEAFPEFAGDAHEGWKTATLEQLLTNHAGVPTNLSADGLWDRLWHHTGPPNEQRLTLVQGVLKRAPDAPPGEKFIYSNAGFTIAGVMAERAAKSTWEAMMRDQVFTPLGMSSAGFGAPGEVETDTPDLVPAHPFGHDDKGKRFAPGPPGTAGLGGARSRGSDNPGAVGPAGIVHCAIEDWAKYIRVHLHGAAIGRGETVEPTRVLGLSGESFKRLHTPFNPGVPSDYAMGWRVATRTWAKGPRDTDAGRVLTHAGSNNLWYCVVWMAPERGFAVLVMCNQGGKEATEACDAAAAELIRRYSRSLEVKR